MGMWSMSGVENKPATDRTDSTRVKWIDEAFWRRKHWWSLRKSVVGTYFATHVEHPGMWGSGDTPEMALDDLVVCIREAAALDLP